MLLGLVEGGTNLQDSLGLVTDAVSDSPASGIGFRPSVIVNVARVPIGDELTRLLHDREWQKIHL